MSKSELDQALSNIEFIKEEGVVGPTYYVVLFTYSDGTPINHISILTSDDAVDYISIDLFDSL